MTYYTDPVNLITMKLRFVNKGGKRVLQQLFFDREYRHIWIDVPFDPFYKDDTPPVAFPGEGML